jgi:hypothetical protein
MYLLDADGVHRTSSRSVTASDNLLENPGIINEPISQRSIRSALSRPCGVAIDFTSFEQEIRQFHWTQQW